MSSPLFFVGIFNFIVLFFFFRFFGTLSNTNTFGQVRAISQHVMTRDPQSRQRPDKIKAKVKAADTREHKEKNKQKRYPRIQEISVAHKK